jgi:pimeloyl-ACP methyl ester carboxylesterase
MVPVEAVGSIDSGKPVFEKAGWSVISQDLASTVDGLASTRLQDYRRQVVAWSKPGTAVILIGASMGGIFALMAAEEIRPKAIVLVNSVLPKGIVQIRAAPKSPSIIHWANGPREDSIASMPDSDNETIDFAWKRWRDESGAVLNEIRLGVEVRRPTCPVLVVLGQADKDVTYSSGLALAQSLHADVHIYAGMSHVGPLLGRRAAEVACGVLAWLEAKFARKRFGEAAFASTCRE